MKIFYFFPLLILFNCAPDGDDKGALKYYDFKDAEEYFLSSSLTEISGLTLHNGMIYAHNDEKGIIYILDNAGKIKKEFTLGIRPLKKDFEGIASSGEFIFLVTSAGVIYKFTESDSSSVRYEEIKTPLNNDFDVEGVCYDPASASLLLACKDYPKRKERNVRPVFTFDIASGKLINKPRFIISVDELRERYGIGSFSPSGIERHSDGNFYILSSNTKAIAVYSPTGELLEAAKLPSKHMQPEGITFLKDNSLVISDEGGKDDAELTVYKYKSGQ